MVGSGRCTHASHTAMLLGKRVASRLGKGKAARRMVVGHLADPQCLLAIQRCVTGIIPCAAESQLSFCGVPGERAGLFIGDATGVGKGRQIAGIILDNYIRGRRRAVWVSTNTVGQSWLFHPWCT